MQIIIHTDGKNSGPYSWEQVRDFLREGRITENDYVWLGEGDTWITLAEALSKFKPPVSLTARLKKVGEPQNPRSKTELLQLRARKATTLLRPLY